MSDETAVFVEPTAAACRILEQLTIDESARVAVLGDGRMGLLVAQVLRTVTPGVIVLGRHEHKLAVARALGLATATSESMVVSDDPGHKNNGPGIGHARFDVPRRPRLSETRPDAISLRPGSMPTMERLPSHTTSRAAEPSNSSASRAGTPARGRRVTVRKVPVTVTICRS